MSFVSTDYTCKISDGNVLMYKIEFGKFRLFDFIYKSGFYKKYYFKGFKSKRVNINIDNVIKDSNNKIVGIQINKGYHGYWVDKNWDYNKVAVFVIPKGVRYYVDVKANKVVAAQVKYIGRWPNQLNTHVR